MGIGQIFARDLRLKTREHFLCFFCARTERTASASLVLGASERLSQGQRTLQKLHQPLMESQIRNHLGLMLYSQVLTQSDLCDVVILVKDGEVRCHSCVIGMTSTKIRQWLKVANVGLNGKKVLAMEALDLQSVYVVLKYTYTGSECFNEVNVGDVMRAATIFDCSSLFESCLNFFHGRRAMMGESAANADSSSDQSHDVPFPFPGHHIHLHRVIRLAPDRNEVGQSPTNSDAETAEDTTDEEGRQLAITQMPSRYKMSELRKYCRECKKGFATVGSYTRHLRMIHYKLKPLACQVCSHAFYQRSDLKKHIQRQHPEVSRSLA